MLNATKDDIERAKRIIKEELPECNDTDLEIYSLEALETSYSLGGGYDESTIRHIVKSLMARKYFK
jgi:hypothetical protein